VAEWRKERHEHAVLQVEITDYEEFRGIGAQIYEQAHGEQAAEALVLADGMRWICVDVSCVARGLAAFFYP
jgi:hypothetical protein